jgi:hypothetical protein
MLSPLSYGITTKTTSFEKRNRKESRYCVLVKVSYVRLVCRTAKEPLSKKLQHKVLPIRHERGGTELGFSY